MKKLIISFLFIVLVAGCNQKSIKHNKDLEESIFTIVDDENNSEISVGALTDFKWDQAFLFEPYTPDEQMEKELGVEFEDPSNLRSRDDIYLLVFLHGGEVVQYAEIDRQGADFSIGGVEFLTPEQDVIEISRD
ncbi:hypothetical protein AS034_01435 [[Bacillus] enclensis]|uniref:Lipoprotein n=1 Tax=[Bacillus] enclensis TaxID=1402860 RepID=A0A0V8HQV5_9BACI|nr:hypothetical protein [[Bacillus] enclensis]KSU64528.1 hypothetical protein AS034_01435 [[Bacillus] enclensis]SCB75596.1 hypothetical protein GA0061094_0297 [[Bacillus] enclensis]